jgi:GABA(A) receptor-associated protein
MSVGEFLVMLRKRIVLTPHQSLFLFVGGVGAILPPVSALMGHIDAQYHDKTDGFLYVTYSGEDTFGALLS